MLTLDTLRDGTEIGLSEGTRLVAVHCWCGLWHAIPADLYRQAKHSGKEVFCPVGHKWVYKKTEAEKLAAELKTERELRAAEVSRHDQTRASLRAQKAVTTRIKNRIHKGVCPHCNRFFKNLHDHMQTEHADAMAGEVQP